MLSLPEPCSQQSPHIKSESDQTHWRHLHWGNKEQISRDNGEIRGPAEK